MSSEPRTRADADARPLTSPFGKKMIANITPTEKVFSVVFGIAWIAAFMVLVWRAEHIYEQSKDSPSRWFWLDRFKVPKTKENCVRFLRGCFYGGILLVAVGALLVLIIG